jgi:uncharacterized protein (TIGR00730 family)
MPEIDKAYKNLDFLTSPAARTIRMLCEYEEPRQRFRDQKVHDTLVFYGSARAVTREQAVGELSRAELEARTAADDQEKRRLEHQVTLAQRRVRLSRYYEDARELARRITDWSMANKKGRYLVCTGGGPGIMEAANRGAADVPGGRSLGLGISLPFEEKLNPYVTPELGFEFHYFFMRKYWFAYLAKSLVIFPGGFGTMDELFEMLTLRQTGKIKKPLPTLLYGADYWRQITDIQTMVDWGTISERDLLLFHRSDSVDDAFDFLVASLEQVERERNGMAEDLQPPERRDLFKED